MILDHEKTGLAFEAMLPFYNKILELDLNDDSYNIIKLNHEELYSMNTLKTGSLSEWLYNFVVSPSCYPASQIEFIDFSRIDNLKKLKTPAFMVYKRLVDETYHDVMIEVFPVYDGRMYLFIKDLTKMGGTNCNVR